ncbi:MAG: TonB-dependent receptor plug domain-containing protein, partial [Novosphingobium sp.]
MPAHAQTAGAAPKADDAELDEAIIVTGIRGSLQRNMDIKRSASGVVDAISAEDIGKFPDANVADALQRLPGISIQRSGSRGEATGVTVRGFGGDFNDTQFDGRRLSTASGGRAVDFTTIGSDFVTRLSVYKTPD